MTTWLNLADGGWWHVAGWTMLHFLWLGTLVGLAAGACRLVLLRASANVRYIAALAWLIVIAALPIGIAAWESAEPQAVIANDNAAITPQLQNAPPALGSAGGFAGATNNQLSIAVPPKIHSESAIVPDPTAIPRQSRGLADATAIIARYLPWVWLIGAPLTFLLLVTGVVGAERLRRASQAINDGPIADACARLVESLRIGRHVTVAICERIAAPVLVGILCPMILLPSSALTGWSPDEIEMVLLHELAHVRRWDNLVNLAQRFVESLLFFHPAVWLTSSWVRREREACCDAVVVGCTNRPRAYAELLVELATMMSEPSEPGRPRPQEGAFTRGRGRPGSLVSSAMAAGPLRSRIHHILGLEDDPMLISGKSLGVVMGGLLLAATLVVLNLPTRGQAEESATEVKEAGANALAVQRAATQNNLKDLAIALLNYHDTKKHFPPRAKFDASGKPLLSWRVLVLPYLDPNEAKLFEEFHLDEPWDSEHNRKLIARMPNVFKNPRIDEPGMTNYLAVVGQECLFDDAGEPVQMKHVTDGTANTIALVEANADQAVEWTKPQDWEFDREHPTAGLGGLWPGYWFAAWVDGSIQPISNQRLPDNVGIQFTRAGGETNTLSESAGLAGRASRKNAVEMAGETTGEAAGFDGESATENTERAEKRSDEGTPRASMGFLVSEDVPFVAGASRFADGDRITISAVEGSSTTFEPGNTYRIEGTYTLASRERATLGANVTALNAAEGRSSGEKNQSMVVERGSGKFSLRLPMKYRGWPHVSFYPANGGQSFGGVYFGTGDSVLKNWWDVHESGDARSAESNAKIDRVKFPSLEEQKLADLAYRRLGIELTPLNDDQLKRVKTLGYDGGLLVTRHGDPVVNWNEIQNDDLLVGLAIWPTTSLKSAGDVLNRDDLADLSPLKFYVVRNASTSEDDGKTYIMKDMVVTGRISVNLNGRSEQHAASDRYSSASIRNDTLATRSAAAASPYSVFPAAPWIRRAIPGESPPPITDENGNATVVTQPYRMVPQPMQVTSVPAATIPPASVTHAADLFSAPMPVATKASQPNRLMFFHAPGSGPSDEMQSTLDWIGQQYPIEIIRVDALAQPALAQSLGIKAVPAVVFFRNDEEVSRIVGVTRKSQVMDAIASLTSGDVPGSASNKPTLRYDGKTFDEWRTAWQTELSTEKRLEAVKALAAFGANGNGEEASAAILEVIEQLDWTSIDTSSAGQLKQACVDAFTSGSATGGYRIALADWLPRVIQELENGSKPVAKFGNYVFYQLPAGETEAFRPLLALSLSQRRELQRLGLAGLKCVDSRLENTAVRNRFWQELQEPNQSPASLADLIGRFIYSDSMSGGNELVLKLRFVPGLESFLLHPNLEVRQSARWAIAQIQPDDAPLVVEKLLAIVDDEARAADRLEAIRALAAVGPNAQAAEATLVKISRAEQDPDRLPAAAALARIWNVDARGEESYKRLFGPDSLGNRDVKENFRSLNVEQKELFGDGAKRVLGGGGGIF